MGDYYDFIKITMSIICSGIILQTIACGILLWKYFADHKKKDEDSSSSDKKPEKKVEKKEEQSSWSMTGSKI